MVSIFLPSPSPTPSNRASHKQLLLKIRLTLSTYLAPFLHLPWPRLVQRHHILSTLTSPPPERDSIQCAPRVSHASTSPITMFPVAAFLYYSLPHLLFAIAFIMWNAEKAVRLLRQAKNALLSERHGITSYWTRYFLSPLSKVLMPLEFLLVKIYDYLKPKPKTKAQPKPTRKTPSDTTRLFRSQILYRAHIDNPEGPHTLPRSPGYLLFKPGEMRPSTAVERPLFGQPNWEMIFARSPFRGEVEVSQTERTPSAERH
ncbi:hypothetical protein B0T14DRAFT_551001 [Immersiella caudata]|uniref:Uncharacterized protein n=1 Tax=Immersiella caudata TaxID=314043 RepID=A0AA39XH13_9PEZI|nr:hypothetical protein B0T14DRAFT_551001 [Immersiella caudata]